MAAAAEEAWQRRWRATGDPPACSPVLQLHRRPQGLRGALRQEAQHRFQQLIGQRIE